MLSPSHSAAVLPEPVADMGVCLKAAVEMQEDGEL